MKVKDLMAELEKHHPNEEVLVPSHEQIGVYLRSSSVDHHEVIFPKSGIGDWALIAPKGIPYLIIV